MYYGTIEKTFTSIDWKFGFEMLKLLDLKLFHMKIYTILVSIVLGFILLNEHNMFNPLYKYLHSIITEIYSIVEFLLFTFKENGSPKIFLVACCHTVF